jgi:hypothetical protein
MKRFVSLLSLAFCLTAGMAQTYKMVVRVNNGTAMGFPDGKIAIPVDNISEVTFEEINEEVIPEGTTPVTFQFKDYTATTRSPMRKAPALTARKYGVFGCYKNGEPLSHDNLSTNLMNNQEVTFVGDRWEYTPIKYWPQKEEGSNYASFFAYSPYANGNGFVSVNSASSEPVIEYNSINPMDDAGDLLYGSKINTTKNDNNGCVTIDSKHALARLNLKAVAALDQISSGNITDTNVKITIKSIKISGQIPNKGSFDLYRQQWKNLSTETQTYALEGDNLAADLRDAGDTFAANQPEGVKYSSKPIGVSPYLFIPTDGEKTITITVEYFITVDDAKLATGYSRVKNVISKSLNLNFAAGYSYDMQIVFGLTSLKCDVSANSSWDNYNINL